MLRQLVAFIAVSLWIGSALADARRDVNRARDLYYEGRYKKAVEKADDALDDPNASDELHVMALKYRAFSLFLLGNKKAAKKAWTDLLRINPEHELSEIEASPEFQTFFGTIRPPAPAQPPPTSATSPPDASTTSQKARRPKPQTCDPYLCAVPFGVGQLANGEPLKAGLFAAAELAFLGVNVTLYWINRTEFERNGFFEDEESAKSRHTTQQVFAVLFAATALGGIVEAYLDR